MTGAEDGAAGERVISILFVCLGNICRSPLAEGVFLALAEARGVRERFAADSCGTGGWHAGEGPDPGSAAVALRNNITLSHTARQLDPRCDFERFDLIIAMDRQNREGVLRAGGPAARTHLLRSFEPGAPRHGPGLDVPDPYGGGGEVFEGVYEIVRRGCEGLLERLQAGDLGRA